MNGQYCRAIGISRLIQVAFRTLQFVFAITVAALYGVDLAHASNIHAHAEASWIYAEILACISALTVIHGLIKIKRGAWCVLDWVLLVLWATQSGIFGQIYLKGSNAQLGGFAQSVQRMKVAVGIDLLCMLLWSATAVHAVWCCIATRKEVRRTKKLEQSQEAGDQIESSSTLDSLEEGGIELPPYDDISKSPYPGIGEKCKVKEGY
jgi:hypothetical protein